MTLHDRNAHRSPPRSWSLRLRERYESKKREDEPAQTGKIWEAGAEQPARVSTAPSSESSEVGWRGSTHHSQGGTQPHCVGLTPSYPQLADLLPPAARVVEATDGLHSAVGGGEGQDRLPPLWLRGGRGGSNGTFRKRRKRDVGQNGAVPTVQHSGGLHHH